MYITQGANFGWENPYPRTDPWFDPYYSSFYGTAGGGTAPWRYNWGSGNYDNWRTGESMSGADFHDNTPYLSSPLYVDSRPESVVATMFGAASLHLYPGEDKYGSRTGYFEYDDGRLSGVNIPFWMLSGSYYNHEYFLSGVEAYGDAAFVMRLITNKLDYSALIPAAISWEINGSAQYYGAASISPIGLIVVLRGQNAGSIRSFRSKGVGIGYIGASTQIIKLRYHYFGNIKNFSLDNTLYSRSWDFEFSAGEFGIVAGANISLMFNNQYPGDFMIGVGSHAGFGTIGISGAGTMQDTDIW